MVKRTHKDFCPFLWLQEKKSNLEINSASAAWFFFISLFSHITLHLITFPRMTQFTVLSEFRCAHAANTTN